MLRAVCPAHLLHHITRPTPLIRLETLPMPSKLGAQEAGRQTTEQVILQLRVAA